MSVDILCWILLLAEYFNIFAKYIHNIKTIQATMDVGYFLEKNRSVVSLLFFQIGKNWRSAPWNKVTN